MKTLLSALLTLILTISLSLSLQAQTFTPKTNGGGGFNVETGTDSGTDITIDGKTYDVFETAKGSKYVKLVSVRSGNSYALWIGEKTSFTHDGRPVYQMKSGTYCVYKESTKSGDPYPQYLDLNQ